MRNIAIEEAGRVASLRPASALVDWLERAEHPELRERVAHTLRRLTNRSFKVAWDAPAVPPAQEARAIRGYRKIIQRAPKTRGRLLAQGFLAAGYRVHQIHERHIWELVRATAAADHLYDLELRQRCLHCLEIWNCHCCSLTAG